MFRKFALPMTLAGICATHAPVATADEDSRWGGTVWAGALFTQNGTMQFPGTGLIADLGTLDPDFAEATGATSIRSLSFRNVFRGGATLGADLTYRASDSLVPFARLSLSRLSGRAMTIGEITSEALTQSAPLRANFGESLSSSLTVGASYLFLGSGLAQPFVTGYVGADHTDTLHAGLFSPTLQSRFSRQTVVPNNTRFLAGLEGGVSCRIGQGTDLKFAVGAEHASANDMESAFLSPFGVDAIRINQRQWTFPAEIGVTYRF